MPQYLAIALDPHPGTQGKPAAKVSAILLQLYIYKPQNLIPEPWPADTQDSQKPETHAQRSPFSCFTPSPTRKHVYSMRCVLF